MECKREVGMEEEKGGTEEGREEGRESRKAREKNVAPSG